MKSKIAQPKVSIIINNYNYGRFLSQAIDSAISQTYPNTEIIVVDDGSTDDSRRIITSYKNKIIPILKQNGGQGSAFNSGFQSCTGECICFLDSDDVFYPNKVEECLKFISSKTATSSLIMVYHLLEVIDKDGEPQNKYKPSEKHFEKHRNNLPNLYEYACKYRFVPFTTGPTSGLMLSRDLAKLIFPIPENGVRYSADNFVVRAALLLGEVYGIEKVLSNYRVHGHNNWENGNVYNIHSNKQYMLLLEEFLNAKLNENNRQPVISFINSMESRPYYINQVSNKNLIKLAWRVVSWHQDSTTIDFFWRTTRFILKREIKRYIKIDRLKTKFFFK